MNSKLLPEFPTYSIVLKVSWSLIYRLSRSISTPRWSWFSQSVSSSLFLLPFCCCCCCCCFHPYHHLTQKELCGCMKSVAAWARCKARLDPEKDVFPTRKFSSLKTSESPGKMMANKPISWEKNASRWLLPFPVTYLIIDMIGQWRLFSSWLATKDGKSKVG